MPNKRSDDKMKLTCWLDREELTELKEEAEAQGIALTEIIAKIVSRHIASKRKRAQAKRNL